MKPTAWFDPSNGVVSTDRDSPLFTPLGQVWPLYPRGEWVGLTDEELLQAYGWRLASGAPNWLLEQAKQELLGALRKVEASIKEKNT
jgi:hypothetical protein